MHPTPRRPDIAGQTQLSFNGPQLRGLSAGALSAVVDSIECKSNVLISLGASDESFDVMAHLCAASVNSGKQALVVLSNGRALAALEKQLTEFGIADSVVLTTSTALIKNLEKNIIDLCSFGKIIVDDIHLALGQHAHYNFLLLAKKQDLNTLICLSPLPVSSLEGFSQIYSALSQPKSIVLPGSYAPTIVRPQIFELPADFIIALRDISQLTAQTYNQMIGSITGKLRSRIVDVGRTLFPTSQSGDIVFPRFPLLEEIKKILIQSKKAGSEDQEIEKAIVKCHQLFELRVLADLLSTAGKVPFLLKAADLCRKSRETDERASRRNELGKNERLREILLRLKKHTVFDNIFPAVWENSGLEVTEAMLEQLRLDSSRVKTYSHPKENYIFDLVRERADEIKKGGLIVVTRFIEHAKYLTDRLAIEFAEQLGIEASCFIAKSEQKVLDDFIAGKSKILVTTSVLDYNLPMPKVPFMVLYDVSPEPARNLLRISRAECVISLVGSGTADEIYARISRAKRTLGTEILRDSAQKK